MKKLGREIKRKREFYGWTQEQLAKMCGMSVTTISGIERGTRASPRLEQLQEIARALKLPLTLKIGKTEIKL